MIITYDDAEYDDEDDDNNTLMMIIARSYLNIATTSCALLGIKKWSYVS